MNRVLGRAALVALALVVVGWLAVGVRAISLESDADGVLERAQSGGAVSAREISDARRTLSDSRLLSPDLTSMVEEGQVLHAVGRDGEALAVARRVIADEPKNFQAWFLAWVSSDPGSRTKAQARQRLLDLNPWFVYLLRAQERQPSGGR